MDLKILLFSLLISLASSQSTRVREYTEIDILRSALLKIGKEPHMNSWKKDEACYDLVHTYKNFEDKMNQLISTNDTDSHLNVLSSLWLWAKTQVELKRIDGIYLNFLRLQEDLLNRQQPLNTRQWTNFANTILSDVNNAIPPSLKRISDFIIHEQLFVSAYQVRSKLIILDK